MQPVSLVQSSSSFSFPFPLYPKEKESLQLKIEESAKKIWALLKNDYPSIDRPLENWVLSKIQEAEKALLDAISKSFLAQNPLPEANQRKGLEETFTAALQENEKEWLLLGQNFLEKELKERERAAKLLAKRFIYGLIPQGSLPLVSSHLFHPIVKMLNEEVLPADQALEEKLSLYLKPIIEKEFEALCLELIEKGFLSAILLCGEKAEIFIKEIDECQLLFGSKNLKILFKNFPSFEEEAVAEPTARFINKILFSCLDFLKSEKSLNDLRFMPTYFVERQEMSLIYISEKILFPFMVDIGKKFNHFFDFLSLKEFVRPTVEKLFEAKKRDFLIAANPHPSIESFCKNQSYAIEVEQAIERIDFETKESIRYFLCLKILNNETIDPFIESIKEKKQKSTGNADSIPKLLSFLPFREEEIARINEAVEDEAYDFVKHLERLIMKLSCENHNGVL